MMLLKAQEEVASNGLSAADLAEIVLSSFVLPALVAFLVAWWRISRQSTEDTKDFYNSVETAALRIERAWYPSDELTPELEDDVITTVESSLDDLRELKTRPLAEEDIVDSIELLNRRWQAHKDRVKKTDNLYQSTADSIKRDCRTIRNLSHIYRPKPLRNRILSKLSRSVKQMYRLCLLCLLEYSWDREYQLSPETIKELNDYFELETIDELEQGTSTIRITSPFDTRIILGTDSPTRMSIGIGFGRSLPNKWILRQSFEAVPITEEGMLTELAHAEDWEIEDREVTSQLLFSNRDNQTN